MKKFLLSLIALAAFTFGNAQTSTQEMNTSAEKIKARPASSTTTTKEVSKSAVTKNASVPSATREVSKTTPARTASKKVESTRRPASENVSRLKEAEKK